jgi:predicted ATP-dependent endonuclease of OLD family
MKIRKLILENFRIFKNRTIIDFNNVTAFVGKNDIGKSTILDAMDIFFNEKDAQVRLGSEDISKGSSNSDIRIGVVFESYPQEIIIDSTVYTSLREEYLLNKDNLLEIHKVFRPRETSRRVKTYIKALHPSNKQLRDLFALKISELKKRAEELGVNLSNEDKRVASKIRKAIRKHFEEEIKLEEIEIPIDEEGVKQIWNQIKNYLPLYALFKADRKNEDRDTEVQDPIKIAIKKLIHREEIRKKLEEIENEIKSEITEIANNTIEKLNEMNPEIAKELKPKIPEPQWEKAFKEVTISSDEDIPLNKRGSGVRRLILLNFFRAEVEKKKEEENFPNIIYAFEEPETSQHPEYQKN